MAKDLKIRIIGDASKLGDALGDAEGKLGGFGGKVGGSLGKIAGLVGGAFAVDKLMEWGSELFSLGSQLEVFDRKAGTVFEGSANDVRKWADGLNEAMGMSDEALVGMAANFGDLLKPMGFTADQAAKMSTDVVGLSGALSAWSGGQTSAAEASDILAKAMLGDRDGLKGLGIAISEADVTARLAKKGQENLTGAALEQAKAVATQELIFEKSADAQKAWADGSMDSVKKTNELKAKFEDLKATLSEKLLPVANKVVGWIVDDFLPGAQRLGSVLASTLGPVVRSAGRWFGDLFDGLSDGWAMVRPVFSGFGDSADGMASRLSPVLSGIATMWGRLWTGVRSVWDSVAQPAFDLVLSVWGSLSAWWDANGQSIISKIQPVISGIGALFADAGALIGTVMSQIGSVIGTTLGVIRGLWDRYGDLILDRVKIMWNTIWGVISGVIEAVRGVINTVLGVITGDWGKAWDGIKSIASGAWNAIHAVVSGAIGLVWNTIQMVGRAISDTMGSVWSGIASAASGAWNWIRTTVSNGVSDVWEAISSLPGKILGIVGAVGNAARAVGSAIIDKIGDGLGAVGGAISEVGSRIWSSIKSFINANFIDKIRNFSVNVLGASMTPFSGLPRLAQGGITDGPMLAMIGDNKSGREAVVPLERAAEFGFGGGGGGQTINVTIQAGVGDPVAIGQELAKVLEEYGRHGGTLSAKLIAA